MFLNPSLRDVIDRSISAGVLFACLTCAVPAIAQTTAEPAATGEAEVVFETPAAVTDAKPLAPQPAADALSPGLAVTYYYDKFYTLDEIYSAEYPEPGEPLANLDHDTDEGNVLGADMAILVGALIRGAIHFGETGSYVLRVNSNDGVRLWVGEIMLWEDPEIHADRMSPPLEIVIAEPGWYDLKVDYYQKKGTSALQLFWTPPGGTEQIVPPEAFAHLP